jgi:hypothetical protein
LPFAPAGYSATLASLINGWIIVSRLKRTHCRAIRLVDQSGDCYNRPEADRIALSFDFLLSGVKRSICADFCTGQIGYELEAPTEA